MTVVQVSVRELQRVKVLVELGDACLGLDEAATLLGVGRRQFLRLRSAFQAQGPVGLVSRKRGRPFGRRNAAAVGDRRRALAAAQGPPPARVPAAAAPGLPGRARADRRAEHWGFEGRGPQCTLLVFIDDATGRLMELRLVETEAAFGYLQSTRAYLAAPGKHTCKLAREPVAFYSDKHSIFRISKADAVQGRGMTQFSRALHGLNIDILAKPAGFAPVRHTPQAKGRAERANKTLQDRLVKEFRLQGVCPVGAGNAALPAFVEPSGSPDMAAYNARFARVAADARDVHRPVAGTDDLDTAFSWQEERTVSGSLTLQCEKALFLLQPSEPTRSLARKRVVVHDFPDGRFEIRHQGQALPYVVFDKGRQVRQGSVVANKSLGTAMTAIKAKQARRGTMIAGSLAALAPAVGTPLPDRLGPVLAYAQTLQGLQGQTGKKPRSATRRPSGARASSDISIGEKS